MVPPISQSNMYGMECQFCGWPLSRMLVFRFHMELVHEKGKIEHCKMPLSKTKPKQDGGKLHRCPQCHIRHTGSEELCRSCLEQLPLFRESEAKALVAHKTTVDDAVTNTAKVG